MTAELSARIHTAAVTALAFVCTYVLAFYWNLDRPFWAGFTVFVISLPSIGQTLQKGVLRMFGTVAGAVAALVLLGLFAQERMLLLFVLSLYLCLMLYLMLTSVYYGYAFFISCIVTLIICLMAVHEPQDAFHLSVYRVEETLLGIGVYTVVTLVFSPRTSIKGLYRGVRDLMAGHKALFVMGGEAGAEGQMSRMYAQYVGMRELLDKVGQLIPAVQLEAYQVYRYREYWGPRRPVQRRTAGAPAALDGNPRSHERFGYGVPFPPILSHGSQNWATCLNNWMPWGRKALPEVPRSPETYSRSRSMKAYSRNSARHGRVWRFPR